MTPPEVADLLRVSLKTLYRLVATDPSFPVLRLGGAPNSTMRFARERLERWLQDHEQGRPRMRNPVRSLSKSAPGQEATSA